MGRGELALDLFRAAAERDGFIIASSNGFKSGDPIDRALEVMSALWNDAMTRYSIDLDRVVAAGFSGGGRICWILDRAVEDVPLAGIIEVGAGLPSPNFLDSGRPIELAYCGLVGDTDFNYYQVRMLEGKLADLRIAHRLIQFPGGHQWPSAEDCGRALDWVRLQGMRKGSVARDAAFIDELYGREIARAGVEEAAGRPLDAYEAYGDIVEGFQGLRDVRDAGTAREEIGSAEGYQGRMRARAEADSVAMKRIERSAAILELIVEEGGIPDSLQWVDIDRDLEIPTLLLESRSGDRDIRLAALRVLAAISVRASSTLPDQKERRGAHGIHARLITLAARIKSGLANDPSRGGDGTDPGLEGTPPPPPAR
jgi:hypothetical protein